MKKKSLLIYAKQYDGQNYTFQKKKTYFQKHKNFKFKRCCLQHLCIQLSFNNSIDMRLNNARLTNALDRQRLILKNAFQWQNLLHKLQKLHGKIYYI